MDDRRHNGKVQVIIMICLISVIVFTSVSGLLITTLSRYSPQSIAKQCVRILYEFDSLDGLIEQYPSLAFYVAPELWEQLSINSDSRAISAYYKFGGTSSKVVFRYASENLILFSLENENIERTRVFAFSYKCEDGLITSLREYECKGIAWGDFRWWVSDK